VQSKVPNLIKNNETAQIQAPNITKNNDIKPDSEIFLINEALREPLLHIANKLLGRQHLNFEQLTPPNPIKPVIFTNS
jgi:hypothetical protein